MSPPPIKQMLQYIDAWQDNQTLLGHEYLLSAMVLIMLLDGTKGDLFEPFEVTPFVIQILDARNNLQAENWQHGQVYEYVLLDRMIKTWSSR